jgi:two-component system, NarL family, nitrate/nitrite response regulator NarL
LTTYDFTAARTGKLRVRPEAGRTRPLKAGLAARPEAAASRIRILIVDHHPVVRDGLRALLSTQPDFMVVAVSGNGADTLRLARELAPDLLLMDPSVPGLSGHDVLRELRAVVPATRTVVLAATINRADTMKVLRLGARGVVLKGAPTELIYKCIRRVHDGELWFNRDLIVAVVESLTASKDAQPAATPQHIRLTPREHEITRHIVGGDTNHAIARRLSVGEDTVKHHLTNIFNKTGVSTRLELALFALHHGLVKA